MKIICKRGLRCEERYQLRFAHADNLGSGFAFDCDSAGRVDRATLSPSALENLETCLLGTADGRKVREGRVETYVCECWSPAIGVCDCGAEVVFKGFTNTCKCGADYNMGGQLLALRALWGEETNETAADILMIK
jgi:hypothetical protein